MIFKFKSRNIAVKTKLEPSNTADMCHGLFVEMRVRSMVICFHWGRVFISFYYINIFLLTKTWDGTHAPSTSAFP